MTLRNRLPDILIATVLLAMGAVQAEDPFLGQIKEIKCVNCKPGWVTLVVHDPIETRDFELYLKAADYNKIITPLPGKRIHDRNGECFYWMERPKAPKPAAPGAADGKAEPKQATVGKTAAKKPGSKSDPTGKTGQGDSALAKASTPGIDTASGLPPALEENLGNPSTCIRFFRQTN